MNYPLPATTPSRFLPLRLACSLWCQSRRNPVCPETPRLDGKLAVVTGGNAGIGLEIGRGLARRGADLVIAARNPLTAEAACDSIWRETGVRPRWAPLDLSDLDSVVRASDRLRAFARGRRVDIFVANAGVWPRDYERSAQGHEIAFAVNTLGHHVLVRRLLDGGLLEGGRVVVLTGDLYVRARECTCDFRYQGARGGGMAYSRSKLGSLWFAAELQRRYPRLHVTAVHPGVVASGLGGESAGFGASVLRALMIDAEAGAQAPLYCATQPDVVRGGYYHNTMGLVRPLPTDPAVDRARAAKLWHRLEELSFGFREATGRSAPGGARPAGRGRARRAPLGAARPSGSGRRRVRGGAGAAPGGTGAARGDE